jgi:hypothetical protein
MSVSFSFIPRSKIETIVQADVAELAVATAKQGVELDAKLIELFKQLTQPIIFSFKVQGSNLVLFGTNLTPTSISIDGTPYAASLAGDYLIVQLGGLSKGRHSLSVFNFSSTFIYN